MSRKTTEQTVRAKNSKPSILRKTNTVLCNFQAKHPLKCFSTVKLLFIFSAIVIATLAILMATEDTSISFTSTFELPELNSLSDLPTFEQGQWAVAVDGEVVATSLKAPCSSDDSVPSGPSDSSSGFCFDLPVTPTASTAKMILALAVMQKKPFTLGEKGETITISQDFYNRYAWYLANNGSTSAVSVGEEISQYDALASTLLVSSNNLADNLAVWAFGSLEEYREYATNMLAEWGIKNTTLGPDASGFDPATTSTSADLALIAGKLLENPVLAEIVGTKTYTVPVAGKLENTNKLLGELGIIGVKTGWIGDVSGYQLVSAYHLEDHTVTIATLGAPTRNTSFSNSRKLIESLQSKLVEQKLASENQLVGYLDTWWSDKIPVYAQDEISALTWQNIKTNVEISQTELKITLNNHTYATSLTHADFPESPTVWQRLLHLFGWSATKTDASVENPTSTPVEPVENPVENSENNPEENSAETKSEEDQKKEAENSSQSAQNQQSSTTQPTQSQASTATGGNCTASFGVLELINPNFPVSTAYIDARRSSLISVSKTYGIPEYHAAGNGDNLMNPEAASHLNDMLKAYSEEYPNHSMGTYSCYRARGTTCGRLCAATGTSDHHTGLTCDLIDQAYGTVLDTDTLPDHLEWQWLKKNSYKYGFIDRFPAAWAGGSMSEPLNVNASGSTGLYETWHYRYVGITAATEIATGKYNNGNYDSLEHYLLARGLVKSLKPAACN